MVVWEALGLVAVALVSLVVSNCLISWVKKVRWERIDRKADMLCAARTRPDKASRIPVTIVTGFLGSGKTTLVNHILSSPDHGKRVFVIENEVGAVSIDHDLLDVDGQDSNLESAGIMVLKNGCMCCSTPMEGDEVEQVIDRLVGVLASDKFDYVLVETSGVADPAPILHTFYRAEMQHSLFYLDACVTLVDSLNFHSIYSSILEQRRERRREDRAGGGDAGGDAGDAGGGAQSSGSGSGWLGSLTGGGGGLGQVLGGGRGALDYSRMKEVESQIAYADRVIISKADLLGVRPNTTDTTTGSRGFFFSRTAAPLGPAATTGVHSSSQEGGAGAKSLGGGGVPQEEGVVTVDEGKKLSQLLEIKEQIRSINPTVSMAVADHGVVPIDFILGVGAFDAHRLELPEKENGDADDATDTTKGNTINTRKKGNHSGGIASLSLEVHDYVDGVRLNEWIAATLDAHHQCIYRTKGICAVVDEQTDPALQQHDQQEEEEGADHHTAAAPDAQTLVIQGVHLDLTGTVTQAWPAGKPPYSRMVLIGKDVLDIKDELQKGFEECVVSRLSGNEQKKKDIKGTPSGHGTACGNSHCVDCDAATHSHSHSHDHGVSDGAGEGAGAQGSATVGDGKRSSARQANLRSRK